MNDNQKLNLTLSIKDWNVIRSAMGKVPYEDISYLFSEMNKQFEVQLNPPAEEVKAEA